MGGITEILEDKEYIDKKIAEGEHQEQDFKHVITSQSKIARTLSAFANTDGGRLWIGVKDNGRIKGIEPNEELHMIQGASETYCQPPVPFEYFVHEYDNLIVLEVVVKPSLQKPHRSQTDDKLWKSYIRIDDETLLANPVLVRTWQLEKKPKGQEMVFDDSERFLLSYLTNNPHIGLAAYCKAAKIKRAKAVAIMAKLIAWEVLSWEHINSTYIYKLHDKSVLETI